MFPYNRSVLARLAIWSIKLSLTFAESFFFKVSKKERISEAEPSCSAEANRLTGGEEGVGETFDGCEKVESELKIKEESIEHFLIEIKADWTEADCAKEMGRMVYELEKIEPEPELEKLEKTVFSRLRDSSEKVWRWMSARI